MMEMMEEWSDEEGWEDRGLQEGGDEVKEG